MNWKSPETETAWSEALSAYLDGELPPGEARALELWLDGDPVRARQLEELRRLSEELQAWAAPGAEPDPEWLAGLGDAPGESGAERTAARFRTTWLRYAAVFLLGAAVGASALHWAGEAKNGINATDGIDFVHQAHPSYSSVSAISPRQADAIMREADAGALRLRFEEQMRSGDFSGASESFETLNALYPGSRALNELQTKRFPRYAAALKLKERL